MVLGRSSAFSLQARISLDVCVSSFFRAALSSVSPILLQCLSLCACFSSRFRPVPQSRKPTSGLLHTTSLAVLSVSMQSAFSCLVPGLVLALPVEFRPWAGRPSGPLGPLLSQSVRSSSAVSLLPRWCTRVCLSMWKPSSWRLILSALASGPPCSSAFCLEHEVSLVAPGADPFVVTLSAVRSEPAFDFPEPVGLVALLSLSRLPSLALATEPRAFGCPSRSTFAVGQDCSSPQRVCA